MYACIGPQRVCVRVVRVWRGRRERDSRDEREEAGDADRKVTGATDFFGLNYIWNILTQPAIDATRKGKPL